MTVRRFEQLGLVGGGGALGAIVRWGTASIPDQALLADAISIPTLLANVTGCLLLGLLVANPLPERAAWFAATGFCGGLTTMSTLAVEVVDGVAVDIAATLAYVTLSIGLGFLGFFVASKGRLFSPETTKERNFQALGIAISASLALIIFNGAVGALDAVFDESLFVFWAFPVAAFAGAAFRAVVTDLDGSFVRQLVGVLAANVLGAFLLGVFTGAGDLNLLTGMSLADSTSAPQGSLSLPILLVWGTGALGAFTTFSTLVAQGTHLVNERNTSRFAQVVLGTVVLSIAAAALGRLLAG